MESISDKGVYLPSFVAIGWAVLTLSWGQGKFVLSRLSPHHTGRRPRRDHGDLGNPPDRGVVARYQKNAPLCDCNGDRRATFVSPIAFPLRPLRQYDAHTTTSRRPEHALSVTTGDLTTMPLRHRRPHYAAWALQLRLLRTYGVRTTILRRPSISAFRCIFGPIPRQARMFSTHFLKIQIRGFLSRKRIMISFKFELLVFN